MVTLCNSKFCFAGKGRGGGGIGIRCVGRRCYHNKFSTVYMQEYGHSLFHVTSALPLLPYTAHAIRVNVDVRTQNSTLDTLWHNVCFYNIAIIITNLQVTFRALFILGHIQKVFTIRSQYCEMISTDKAWSLIRIRLLLIYFQTHLPCWASSP